MAGQVNINFAHLLGESYYHIANTLVHEILHVMGFDPEQFPKYREKGIYGERRYDIVSQLYEPFPQKLIIEPKVVEYARKYFGCENLIGVPLQSSAGVGSDDGHWLFEVLAEEIMSPYDTGVMQKISMFTLLLMNSTGWWEVERKEDGMTWGKGKGCDFLKANNFARLIILN